MGIIHLSNSFNRLLSRLHRPRGMTLVETSISTLVMAGIGAFVVGVTVLSARQTNKTIATLPAETNAFRGMDRVRLEILATSAGSAEITNNGRTIEYYNEGDDVTSQLYYDANSKTLKYDRDVDDSNDAILELGSYEDVTFGTKEYGRYVSVTVKEQGKNTKGQPVVMTRQEWLRVRN